MTADSIITNYFNSGRTEYDKRSKCFVFPGVGCVTTWGEQIHNKIGRFLYEQEITSQKYSVVDLAEITYHYLTQEYRPKDDDLDEVGYHIGGFDRQGNPRFFHVFWGFDRPRPPEQEHEDYKYYDHSNWNFVYNGRNDLAHTVVEKLILELDTNAHAHYDLSTIEGTIKFCDFVARFAGGLTPEVGPPFVSHVISPDNLIATIKNDTFSPIDLDGHLGATPPDQITILFSDAPAIESQVFAMPTGVQLNSMYDAHNTSQLIRVCPSCGTHYIDNGNVLGTLPLCPDCRAN